MAALLMAACVKAHEHPETTARLDRLIDMIEKQEQKNAELAARLERVEVAANRTHDLLASALAGAGAGDGGGGEREPKRPDPATVFSVPIDGDPVKGPKTAKVTIVEAAEFA